MVYDELDELRSLEPLLFVSPEKHSFIERTDLYVMCLLGVAIRPFDAQVNLDKINRIKRFV